MLKTIRMDLILNRNAVIANLLIFSAFLVFMSSWEEGNSPRGYAFFSGLMVAFIPIMIVTREDKFKAVALGCSLPQTRRSLAKARYALSVGVAGLGILFTMSLGSWFPTSDLSASVLFRLPVLLTSLSVSMLIVAVVLPFTLRFGAMGLILVLGGLQVLGVLLLTLVKVTRSVGDHRLVDWIINTVSGLHDRIGAVGFDLLLVVFLALVLLASYTVSVWVFQRREL